MTQRETMRYREERKNQLQQYYHDFHVRSQRKLTPIEKQFLQYFYCALGYDPDQVRRVLDRVVLYDPKYVLKNFLAAITLANRAVQANTHGDEQYYRDGLPAKDSPTSIGLIGHETMHSLHYNISGYFIFLTKYVEEYVEWALAGHKNPGRAILTEAMGYAIRDTINEFLYLLDILKNGGCIGSKEADLIKHRFYEHVEKYLAGESV